MKKRNLSIFTIAILVVFLISFVSAGFFDFLKPTGKATTDTVDFNVSVTSGTPVIWNVDASPAVTPTVGPGATYFHINFSVNDSDGIANIVNTSAMVNISSSGEVTRFNTSCVILNYGGFQANFTCLVTTWWFDGNGAWDIGVNVTDQNSNTGSNTASTQTINILHGVEMYPSSLTFSTLTPGTYNQTPSNYLILNNTGNQNYVSTDIELNATDLRGEDTSSQALWAGNFSASHQTGGNIECNITASATQLVNMTYTELANVVMNKGNYTPHDGTAQENVYLCLREVGSELSQQYYSTNNLGAWTLQVT